MGDKVRGVGGLEKVSGGASKSLNRAGEGQGTARLGGLPIQLGRGVHGWRLQFPRELGKETAERDARMGPTPLNGRERKETAESENHGGMRVQVLDMARAGA